MPTRSCSRARSSRASTGSRAFIGAYVLRRERGTEVEFATLTLWDTLSAVRAFAGEDHERAVVPAEARALLAHFEERSDHHEVVLTPPRPSSPPSA